MILLETMAHEALACRKLTDIGNGCLGLSALRARCLMARGIGPSLEQRYLFEGSVVARCAWLGLELREFEVPRNGDR